MYSVKLSDKAYKFLTKLDSEINIRIKEKLKQLKENPFPSDSKFITRIGEDKVFRYRIGSYRALYKVKHIEKIVLIAKIDKRPKIYKSM